MNGPNKSIGSEWILDIVFPKVLDVSSYCLEILNRGMSLEPINITNIVLIPNISHLKNLTNFRPISLCTIIYNLIFKTVTNMLQKVLDICIDEAQNMFVPGHLIIDNVLRAYEILHI
ncbi:reverse transcriptase [Gossypium australe]|uniref:Reverse transcriptase n=1 Tax=Gossypium australe TaxID=47621 RepID=A0A5B6W2F0_9ROSI|nr:reverse transcriptase [Gossypium australe]